MDFREFVEGEDSALGESVFSGALKRGVVAGSLALSAFVPGRAVGSESGSVSVSAPSEKVPIDMELVDELKDKNQYWDSSTVKKIVAAAKGGDEWAVREIAWPKGHPFHKKGRPFFRNDKPHPKGLFPYSGH